MAPANQSAHAVLLFLPPASFAVTSDSVKAAYQEVLSLVLNKIWKDPYRQSGRIVLDIVVPTPVLWERRSASRRSSFPDVQRLVAGIYALVTIIAAHNAIELDNPAGIDARVLLLVYGNDGSDARDETSSESKPQRFGPIIYPQTLPDSKRSWHEVYAHDERIISSICERLAGPGGEKAVLHRLPATTPDLPAPRRSSTSASQSITAKHHHVAVGGTFDHLHIGHKLLLTMSLFLVDPSDRRPLTSANTQDQDAEPSLTIGITGDELLKNKKYAEVLESWTERQESVQSFISAIIDFRPPESHWVKTEEHHEPGPNGHAVKAWFGESVMINCVEIWDPFGPTITDKKLTALVLSAETRSGGKSVNEKRHERGWPDLEIHEVDVLNAKEEDKVKGAAEEEWENKISSTAIRKSYLEKLTGQTKI